MNFVTTIVLFHSYLCSQRCFEKVVYQHTVKHLNDNDLLYCKQFGFRKFHSTSDAINLLISEILESWNKGMSVVGVFIDLRKAFDTVSHELILKKLAKLGIGGQLLHWFTNYLYGRKQFVKVGQSVSEQLPLSVGVPQGSLLGVLLFQIFVDDLRKSVRFGSVILYADDTTILLAGNNLKFLQKKLQADLESLATWLSTNNLVLNVKKTKAILFQRSPHLYTINLKMHNESIEFVEHFKFLGFNLDYKLNCEVHFSHVHSKMLQGNIYAVQTQRHTESERT